MSSLSPICAIAVARSCGTRRSCADAAPQPRLPNDLLDPVDAPRLLPHKELVLIYIGGSTCCVCNRADVREIVGQALTRLADAATAIGFRFRSAGIAIDQSPDQGLIHLASIGTFREVSSGGDWHNLAAARFLWSDTENDVFPAIPQIFVVYRRIDYVSRGHGWHSEVGAEIVVLRLLGAVSLKLWAEASFPIPWDDAHNLAPSR